LNICHMTPIPIWLLVHPGFLLLDATGPAQVFSSANDEARDAGLPEPYAIHLTAAGGAWSPPPPA
jgi:transcriptional regulator GlxA family with amidase domain